MSDKGPVTAVSRLNAATLAWHSSLTRTDTYTVNQNLDGFITNYTVNYVGMKARLPEAEEIAVAVGHTWDENTSTWDTWFYFDSLNQTPTVGYGKEKLTSDYAWLFNNLGIGNSTNDASSSTTCLHYGCTQNLGEAFVDNIYWTSTSTAGSSSRAWRIYYLGRTGDYFITDSYSVRPVITLKFN